MNPEIILYGIIGETITDQDVARQLRTMGDVSEVNVRINSPGGSAYQGIAIYNALVRHPAEISVDIGGLAASAAVIVAMAASPGKLRIAANATMMIHRSHVDSGGNSGELSSLVERLLALDEIQASTFATRMKATKQDIMRMMVAETRFSAKEAVNVGLADKVTGASSIAAYDLSLEVDADFHQQSRSRMVDIAATGQQPNYWPHANRNTA